MRELQFRSKTNPTSSISNAILLGVIPFFHLPLANDNLIVMKHDRVSISGFHCVMYS